MSDDEIITMAVLIGFEWRPIFGEISPYYNDYGTYRSPVDGSYRIHTDGKVAAAKLYLMAAGIDLGAL